MVDWKISAGTILGVLLSVLLAHRLSKRREAEANLNESIREFENGLVEFITALEDIDANPNLMVQESFPEHDRAARKLLNSLPKKKTNKFKRKWEEYRSLYEEKKEMGLMVMLATEVDDLSKANDQNYIYQQNTKRRMAVLKLITEAIDELK
ncbi:MAG: hypothetical protein ABW185_01850 [Sedimenticola sp.]